MGRRKKQVLPKKHTSSGPKVAGHKLARGTGVRYMVKLLGWVDALLGIVLLLGVSKTVASWQLTLSLAGNPPPNADIIMFIIGLLMLVSGICLAFAVGGVKVR